FCGKLLDCCSGDRKQALSVTLQICNENPARSAPKSHQQSVFAPDTGNVVQATLLQLLLATALDHAAVAHKDQLFYFEFIL
ncbi:MAG: hypothetical protein ACYDBH_18570, partial [Acidobacteriaceae bacterium]